MFNFLLKHKHPRYAYQDEEKLTWIKDDYRKSDIAKLKDAHS